MKHIVKMFGGLGNVSNTCYVNTAIQCLVHCKEFRSYVLQDNHENLMGQLHDVVKMICVDKHGVMPKRFLKYLRENMQQIELFEQNDINEFLAIFIDKLNQSVARNIKVTREDLIEKYKYSTSDYDVQRFKMDMSWYEKTEKEYSPLVPMLHGQTISQIVCGNCGKIFHNYEMYFNLMLPVSTKTHTIYDCLDEYFQDEHINTDQPIWTCDSCQKKCTSTKTTRLWRNPNILIVSLKRFTMDLQKNNVRIDVPEVLDLSKYCLTKTNNRYKLQSVAHHFGSFDSGHYHAICNKDNNWYDYDDLNVKEVKDPSHVHGYVFFYSLDKS